MADRPPTFNELLIREVQNHPELYDQQHRVCTDNEERNMMWEVIARRIDDNVTGEFAKKRWLQMRDRYRKELKMALRNMTQPKWPYFEKLSWLDPYLKDSKSAGLHPAFGFEAGGGGGAPEGGLFAPLQEQNGGVGGAALWSPASMLEGGGGGGPHQRADHHPLPDFGAYGVNANALLENIMAASSNAFEQLQLQRQRADSAGERSPDSAVASTSEDDADPQTHLKEPSSSTAASETGSSHGSQHQQRGTPSPAHHKPDDASNSESGQSSEHLGPLESAGLLAAMPGLTNADGTLSFMGSVIRNLSAQVAGGVVRGGGGAARAAAGRNPPYLVRRGGGIKSKPEAAAAAAAAAAAGRLSAVFAASAKPLHKSVSVGAQLAAAAVAAADPAADDKMEWTAGDEDALFARLVAVRLRKFAAKDKRLIRARISEFLDEKEDQVELNKMHT